MGSSGPKQRAQTPTASSVYSVSQTRHLRATAGTALSFLSLETSSRACGSAGLGTLLVEQVAEASSGRFPQPLSMPSGSACPLRFSDYTRTMELRSVVMNEASAARRAAAALDDEAVAAALCEAAALVRERARAVLAANAADCDEATGRLDEGMLDRLRLDERRVEAMAEQVEATARLAPLEREISTRTLENGLVVSERRVPIGVVGANFEARPNVALDVAGQLLKSLNAGVLRTGGAALRTVTVLVDEVLRPALEAAALPPAAIGLVRSADREGARVLVSLPSLIPLVILRGSGP